MVKTWWKCNAVLKKDVAATKPTNESGGRTVTLSWTKAAS